MSLLFCSKDDNVLKRWSQNLSSSYINFHSSVIEHLDALHVQFKVDLIMLHKNMVTYKQMSKIFDSSRGYKVFLLSDKPTNEEGAVYIKMGCVGYANTYMAPNQMLAAVQSIDKGRIWVGRSLMQYLIQGMSRDKVKKNSKLHPHMFNLSNREYQVATYVAEGFENKEIAGLMEISESTVRTHLSSIYMKAAVKDRLNLALLMHSQVVH